MATISENLEALKVAKANIKSAIEEKGQDLTDVPFTQYGEKILNIVSGSSSSPKFNELVDGSIVSLEESDLSGINEIRENTFSNCTSLTSVAIPSNVTTIGANAFQGCSNLQTLTLNEGVETIGANAFDGINASEIEIPNTVNVLESEVFANNTALTSIIIPDGVAELKDNVFSGCTNLNEITMESTTPPIVTETSIPSSVTAINVPYSAYDSYLEEWSTNTDEMVRLPAIPSTIMVIVDNYLGEKVSDASVTITGNGLTFTGTTDSQGVFTQGDLQPATYTISVADIDGFKTPEVQEIIVTEGSNNTAMITYLEKPSFAISRVFSENTPEVISAISAEISAKNMTSSQVAETYGWNLGDTKDITLSTGEVIQMQIIGFNHDDKSDGSGKAGITLQMKDCLATLYSMNKSDTTAGGYASSVMKTSTLPTIKSTLPQSWQDVIKLVNKKSANGGGSYYSETLTLSEDLFLLSQIEVFGEASNAQDGVNEGSIYEYWNGKNDADRIKKQDTNADGVSDTEIFWSFRSVRNNHTANFRGVYIGGTGSTVPASYSRGVSFAFCV